MFGWVQKLLESVSRESICICPGCVLFLSAFGGPSVHEPQNTHALHHTSCGVAQELAVGLQCAIYADIVLWSHEEIARLGWMVRGLLGNVVALRLIRILPIARERLPENWIQWLLNAPTYTSARVSCVKSIKSRLRWPYMPTTQVELHHREKTFDRILDLRHWK